VEESVLRAPVSFLVFAASLRAASLNAKLARLAAQEIEACGGQADLAAMRDFDCPSYDQDVQDSGKVPPGAVLFRERLERADAFVICSPEYNFSMPGVLKNAIDWVSRMHPQPFNERHGLLMSVSPSLAGGNRGLWALRVPLEHLGARLYPEMFSLAQAGEAFTAGGDIANPELRTRFADGIQGFMDLVEAAKHYPCTKRQWIEFPGEPGLPAGQAARVKPGR